MNVQQYQALLLVITGTLALIVASPALQRLLIYPQRECFTEMWLLGPNHMAENYPFTVKKAENLEFYLGISNHLGHCAYYLIQVKLRNQTQQAADSLNRTSSTLPSLYTVNAFVANEETWERPILCAIGFVQEDYEGTLPQVRVTNITFNDYFLDIGDFITVWDSERSGFFANLFFELWIYNYTVGEFQYHERSVGLWLNMTS
jgi:uncharacterized membrane protein